MTGILPLIYDMFCNEGCTIIFMKNYLKLTLTNGYGYVEQIGEFIYVIEKGWVLMNFLAVENSWGLE